MSRPLTKTEKKIYGNFKTVYAFTKQVQKEFNKLVTSQTGFCQRCGSRVNRLDCSHVKSVGAWPNLRFDILNVLALCSATCHKYWWHEDPTEATTWFKNKFPERAQYLETAKLVSQEWTLQRLQEIRDAVRRKDISNLHLPIEKLPLDKVDC